MEKQNQECIIYKKAPFTIPLPKNLFYTSSHFWFIAENETCWRAGYTKFSFRMLGDIVEHEFQVKEDETIAIGQIIGWLEGFKGVSDIVSPFTGKFKTENTCLHEDPSIIYSDPYGKGWLFKVEGEPEQNYFDVHGYINFLDTLIDKIILEEGRHT